MFKMTTSNAVYFHLPIGLPNAAETPDAAPAATKSRRSSSVRSASQICDSQT